MALPPVRSVSPNSDIVARPITELLHKEFGPFPEWIGPRILPKRGTLLFGGYAKIGKALADDEPVLTKNRDWVRIADLCVGDELSSIDGEPSTVLDVVHHTDRPLYRVEFWDGRSVVADAEHLWYVGKSQTPGRMWVKTTAELAEVGSNNSRGFWVPPVNGILSSEGTSLLPIDPWVFGILLGDGSFRSVNVTYTTADAEIADRMCDRLGAENIVRISKYGYSITDGALLKRIVEDFGLADLYSEEKFIPEIFMQADRESRLELLRGLLDSDGYVAENGSIDMATSSERMAQQIQQLVWSLGGLAKIASRIPHYTHNGEYRAGLLAYRIHIRHYDLQSLVWLPRKRNRIIRKKQPRITIQSITPIENGPATCIAVSHPSHLFITRDYIATHNSFFMLSLARALAMGETPFDDPEMTVAEPCRVLMIEQELGEYGLQERGVQVFAGANESILGENLFYVSKEPSLQLDTDEGIHAIEKLLKQSQANVLIIDPVSWMHGYDENSNTHIAKLFHTLETLKRTFIHNDLSIILSHHFGKPNNDPKFKENHDPLDPYNFRGAGKWKDAPDTLVTMDPQNHADHPHRHWEVETSWLTRHGAGLPNRQYSVNLKNDLRVYYKPAGAKAKRKFDAAPSLDDRMKVRRQFL